MNKSIKSIILLVIVLICSICSVSAEGVDQDSPGGDPVSIRGEVVEVLSQQSDDIEYSGGSIQSKFQIVLVKIQEGRHKGEIVEAEHQLDGLNPAYDLVVKKGDGVLLYLEEDSEGKITNVFVTNLIRDKYLIYLAAVFIILLLIIGRSKGLKAVISLALTCLAVIKVLIPLLLKGFDPVRTSVFICIAVIAITLLIISGFNKKTAAAIIGTAGGLITAGIIALIMGAAARLTGLGNEESMMLMYIPQDISFNFKGLLFAGILIGALGAVMDVGMSIASSMYEIEQTTPDIKTPDLIKAGMNVGRDIMATMSNTLILAYAGGSMQLLILFMAYDIPLIEIINSDYMASEVVRALAGSIGLIFTIPITAIATGFIRKVNSTKKRDYRVDYRY